MNKVACPPFLPLQGIYMILVLVLFLQSCSWVTDFYIVNRSDKHIIITYFDKQSKNPSSQEIKCFFEQPIVCKEEDMKTGKCRTLKPDEYSYNQEKCTIELTLAPGDAVKIDRACCSYTGPESFSPLGSLIIKTPGGSIRYEGIELLKAFEKIDKTLYVLYYR